MRFSFPGMDPCLEAPGRWTDVHDSCITHLRHDLDERDGEDGPAGHESLAGEDAAWVEGGLVRGAGRA